MLIDLRGPMKKLTLLLALFLLIAVQPAPAFSQPGAATPVMPENRTRLGAFTTDLSWEVPEGAAVTQTHLQVTPAGNDGPGIDLILSLPEPKFTVPAPPQWYGLLPDMTYTWRVRLSDATVAVGVDDPSWSDWSEAWSFRTPPLSAVTIGAVSPAINGQTGSLTPILAWNDTNANAWYYEVQVSKDPVFGPNAFLYWELRHGAVTNPPRSYAVPAEFPLERGTTYYWRVRPRVQGDGTPVRWSSTFSFATSDAAVLTPLPGLVSAQVTGIIDGSTIEAIVEGIRREIRYLGVTAPSVRPPQCYGGQAAARNSELVEGQIVQLEKDVSEADPEGRLLRYVYVHGAMVNALLLEEGYVRFTVAEPDLKHRELLMSTEAAAHASGLGLWGAC